MKSKRAYLFVDDGYPEAADYDNNFIFYDTSVCGSCENALREAADRFRPPENQAKLRSVLP